MIFNFGSRPFRYRSWFNKPNYVHPSALNEPECLIKNYHPVGFWLMELVKRYTFEHLQHPEVNIDLRFMVGSILWEYMLPLFLNEETPFLIEH